MRSSPDRMGAVVSAPVTAVALEELGSPRDNDASARLDGFRVGRDEGYAAGLAEGREAATVAMAGLLDGLRAAVQQVEAGNGVAEDRVAGLSVALAVELAEAIVGGDLSLRETGEDLIVRALGLRRPGETVRIRVHPAHPALTELPARPGVELVADPELGPNDAFAEVGEGIADLSISTAIERVRSALS